MGSPGEQRRTKRRSRFRIGPRLGGGSQRRLLDPSGQPLGLRTSRETSNRGLSREARRMMSWQSTESIELTEEVEVEKDTTDRRSIASTADESESSGPAEQRQIDDLVQTESSVLHPDDTSLQAVVHIWTQDAQALLQSREMAMFLSSSGSVFIHASNAAAHVALLPLTVPLHVVAHTTGIVGHVVAGACSAIDRAIFPRVGQNTASQRPMEGLIHNVANAVPFAFHVASRVKDELGAAVLGLLLPHSNDEDDKVEPQKASLHRPKLAAGESSKEKTTFLERLRLDYDTHASAKVVQESPEGDASPRASPRSSDVTKYLLRVCDLGLSLQEQPGSKRTLHCIDLTVEFANATLTMQALDSLVTCGIQLLCSNPETRFTNTTTIGQFTSYRPFLIDWKPEGATEKLLKKRSTQPPSDWIARMEKRVLVWSGKFRDKRAVPHGDVPLFLSRGIVPMSPLDLLQLFWDNRRTTEYNKFCLGRSNSLVLEPGLEQFLSSSSSSSATPTRGTKIVKSETQVPFTGLSVVMSTLMHARRLEIPSGQHCYIIVSRTLNPGKAGCHYGDPSQHFDSKSKNEILWGVNLIKSVQGKPEVSELTAVSQVRSAMVPPFLAHRVGLMAVESCFNAMRS